MTRTARPPQYQNTPLILMLGLAVVFAAILALLGTPGAWLVLATAIVIPGFVIDRAGGGTGILGGTVSSPILAVSLGIAYVYLSTSGTFEEFLAACPGFYFLFVISLIWGGVLSMTLYWVLKTLHERRARSPAARHSRIQFTLGQLMGLILVCALVFAALSTPFAIFVAAVGIVVPGFFIDRYRGGAGVVGGMISASAILVGLALAAYTYFYLNPNPQILSYLGPPVLTLPMVGIAGAVWGALAGTLTDVSLRIKKSYKTGDSLFEESSPAIIWLPDETKAPRKSFKVTEPGIEESSPAIIWLPDETRRS
jgi:hypothetical protein